MIRPTSLVLLTLFGCTAPSASSAADNRIRTRHYEPDQIVTISGKSGIQSTIEFGSDEHIESVAVGDSAAWQITPNRRASLLFVKPLVASTRTNMTVVTDQRTYLFDLVAGRHEGAPIYVLKFSYPKDAVTKAKPAQPLVVASTPAPPSPAHLNFGWKLKGVDGLTPKRVFDDGVSAYIAWTREVALPAVSTLTVDGKEASLSYRVAGDYIVVTPVPGNIVLRYGKKIATASRILSRRERKVQPGPETRTAPSLPSSARAGEPTAASPRELIARPQVATSTTPPEQPAPPGDKARLTAAQ